MEFNHYSVMLKETVDALMPEKGGIFVDGTLGGGGHSFYLASKLPCGSRLIGIDRDGDAILAATERLKPFSDKFVAVQNNYYEIDEVLNSLGISEIDGIMLDLGVSSFQLDTPERGFSYMHSSPLDMRMDKRGGKSAYDVVNEYTEDELKRIIFEYGEEKFAARISSAIVTSRAKKPIETTFELVDIIKSAMPAFAKGESQHPAKRTFQAIRIEVNNEIKIIEPAIRAMVRRLKKGGRIAVITFHSLEDRAVKQTFADMARGCICPPSLPVCVCNHKPEIELVLRKPILPSESEIEINPRSRSAKLRVAIKL